MTGYTAFSWRGEPIHDIHAWALARGEQMVVVDHEHRYLSAVTLREHIEHTEEEMPESFWSGHIAARGVAGGMERWTEVRRYTPHAPSVPA